MKLLFCPMCHDVMGLIQQEWRTCFCGASGGQYNVDNMTATIGGVVRVFGIGNPFFNELYPYLDVEGKRRMRTDMYGQPDTDAWWGEYEGDQQLFRIKSGIGPRLKVRLENSEGPMMKVIIVDKREYFVGSAKNQTFVIVPKNPLMRKITRWQKKKKKKVTKPKTLFLNEQHETHVKKDEK